MTELSESARMEEVDIKKNANNIKIWLTTGIDIMVYRRNKNRYDC